MEKDDTVEDSDDNNIEIELVATTEALKTIDIIELWELQQENREQATLLALDRIKRRIVQVQCESRRQTMITSFFKPRE
jgi:hypothetical protein